MGVVFSMFKTSVSALDVKGTITTPLHLEQRKLTGILIKLCVYKLFLGDIWGWSLHRSLPGPKLSGNRTSVAILLVWPHSSLRGLS